MQKYGCRAQIAGADQWGNIVSGTELGRRRYNTELFGFTSPIITDAAGKTRKLGYINLPSFYSNASSITEDNIEDLRSATIDMEKAILELKKDNVEGIILDLRSNGGGSLPEAISITGLFIKRGPVVLVKERFRVHTLRDDNSAVAYNGPLVVLIDKLSASASEIVAGALQDHKRADVFLHSSGLHSKLSWHFPA